MNGFEYRQLIGRYVVSAYGARGVDVYEEVSLGTSTLGKTRRLDLLLIESSTNRGLGLECKFQDSAGTADEKIPYALEELRALRIPGAIVYAGSGFSDGVLHLLQSSPLAAYCLPEPSLQSVARTRGGDAIHRGTWQLDHVIAQTFGFWDVVLGDKKPLRLSPQNAPLTPTDAGPRSTSIDD